MGKASVSSFLVVLLNVAWYIVALAMVLAIGLAGVSAFHDIGNGQSGGRGTEIDIPVSFSVDAKVLPVSAPSLGIEGAQIEHVRGSLKFSPPPGASLVAPALLGLAIMLALVLFVLGQLRAVFRTLRDRRPFVPANAARIRWIAFAVIAGEIARAAGCVFRELPCDDPLLRQRPALRRPAGRERPHDRSWVDHSRDRGSLQDGNPPGRRPVTDDLREQMAIRVKLDHLLLDRRLTLTELADRIGITIANLSVLKTNKAKAFDPPRAVCRELTVSRDRRWTAKRLELRFRLWPIPAVRIRTHERTRT